MPEIFDSSKTGKPSSPKESTPGPHKEAEEVLDASNAPENTEESTPRMTHEKRRAKHVDEYSNVMRHEAPTRNVFAAFAAKPFNVAFEAQHSEEQVILLLRQHVVTQVKYILIVLGLLFVPVLVSSIGMLSFLPTRFQFVANIGWYLIVLSYALEVFLSWFYNVYIITDERVIDVDFNSLLFKNVSYAKIDNIEDVSATTAGALGSIFDYGNVRIQTAGTVTEFEFENVPHPSKVVSFLNEMMIEEEQEQLDRRAI